MSQGKLQGNKAENEREAEGCRLGLKPLTPRRKERVGAALSVGKFCPSQRLGEAARLLGLPIRQARRAPGRTPAASPRLPPRFLNCSISERYGDERTQLRAKFPSQRAQLPRRRLGQAHHRDASYRCECPVLWSPGRSLARPPRGRSKAGASFQRRARVGLSSVTRNTRTGALFGLAAEQRTRRPQDAERAGPSQALNSPVRKGQSIACVIGGGGGGSSNVTALEP